MLYAISRSTHRRSSRYIINNLQDLMPLSFNCAIVDESRYCNFLFSISQAFHMTPRQQHIIPHLSLQNFTPRRRYFQFMGFTAIARRSQRFSLQCYWFLNAAYFGNILLESRYTSLAVSFRIFIINAYYRYRSL